MSKLHFGGPTVPQNMEVTIMTLAKKINDAVDREIAVYRSRFYTAYNLFNDISNMARRLNSMHRTLDRMEQSLIDILYLARGQN